MDLDSCLYSEAKRFEIFGSCSVSESSLGSDSNSYHQNVTKMSKICRQVFFENFRILVDTFITFFAGKCQLPDRDVIKVNASLSFFAVQNFWM